MIGGGVRLLLLYETEPRHRPAPYGSSRREMSRCCQMLVFRRYTQDSVTAWIRLPPIRAFDDDVVDSRVSG